MTRYLITKWKLNFRKSFNFIYKKKETRQSSVIKDLFLKIASSAVTEKEPNDHKKIYLRNFSKKE